MIYSPSFVNNSAMRRRYARILSMRARKMITCKNEGAIAIDLK
jgi:hypothetical protein